MTNHQSILGRMTAQRAHTLPTPDSSSAAIIDLSGEFVTSATTSALRAQTVHAIEHHLCDHYTRRPGIVTLCRTVASSLSAAGVPLDENLVTICGGVAEARFVAVRSLATRKDVYLPSPAPAVYHAGLEFAEGRVHIIDLGGRLPKASSGLLIASNPNPVTGQVIKPDSLHRLAAWAIAADLEVIADESAGPIRPDALFVRLASLPGMAERTVTIGSFSKSPGLGAWHVSWIAGAKRVLTSVRDLKQSITICTAAASQYAALAATAAVDESEIGDQFAKRMQAVLSLLDRHKIAYLEPDTLAFVVAHVVDSSAVTSTCRANGVLVGDGALLGNPGTIRITVPSGSIGIALAALDGALNAVKSV